MLYFTNEIMKQRVSGLGEEHRKLYKFFSDYYRELNTAPLIEDMVFEMRASSKRMMPIGGLSPGSFTSAA